MRMNCSPLKEHLAHNFHVIQNSICDCGLSVEIILIKRPAKDVCLHMGGILAEGSAGSAVSAGSASLPAYSVFTSGWNFFKLGTYI